MPFGAPWRHADLPLPGWSEPDFADSQWWPEGRAPLGYGQPGLRSELPRGWGPDDDEFVTVFRHAFRLADPARVERLRLRLERDDGAVVFLNGVELLRSNVADQALAPELPATTPVEGGAAGLRVDWLPADALRPGENVLAVQLHQTWKDRDDLRFDLELAAITAEVPLALLRGPYLQRATPTGVRVLWRTNRPAACRLRYGRGDGPLAAQADSPRGVEHEVALEGLAPATRYAYALACGDREPALAEGLAFVTPPAPGARDPLRIWVLGDSGTGDSSARAVRDAFLRFAGGRAPDVWLMLGDNAYPTGSDAEHQSAIFDVYPGLLSGTVLWPVLGNHDAKSSDARAGTGPFFDAFAPPTAGEAGGVPSGHEAYYSFQHGNAHFIALDTEGSRLREMADWLRRDLAATRADWRIAYWHRPFLSRGTSGDDAADARAHPFQAEIVPILERAGVDVVLAGHSHDYERSLLLGPTRGDPGRVGEALLDAGSGDPQGSGAYRKRGVAGALWIVAGSSGQTAPAPLDHPAMARSLAELGSLVLDVEGCALDGRFIDDRGRVRDRFRIEKDCP